MIDLTNLTPAPWKVWKVCHDPDDQVDNDSLAIRAGDGAMVAEAWPMVGDSVDGFDPAQQANADFIALARNAFAGDPEALAWWEENRTRAKKGGA